LPQSKFPVGLSVPAMPAVGPMGAAAMELGRTLLPARRARGLSQADRTDAAGVIRVEVHRIERGRRWPRPDVSWHAS
jgi:hypothetical protein